MSSNSSESHFKTPDTYLNHFKPSDAAEWEFDRNIFLAILGATVWDFLVYIPDDIKILRRNFGVVSLCFLFSRVFMIIYLILSVLMYTRPLSHCQAMNMAAGILNNLGVAFFAVLFVRRVQAVYHDRRRVQWAFSCLWLLHIGTLVAAPFALHARPRGGYCVSHDKRDPKIGSIISFLLFDSLVFFAISYRIAMSTYNGYGPRLTWNTVISGKAVPRFSRAVLQGGQQYYLIMIIFNLGNLIVHYIDEAQAYRPMFTPICTALGASMACRVYRNIMFFEYNKQSTTLPVNSTVNFVRNIPGQPEDRGQTISDTVGSGSPAGVDIKGSLRGYEGRANIELTNASDKPFKVEL